MRSNNEAKMGLFGTGAGLNALILLWLTKNPSGETVIW